MPRTDVYSPREIARAAGVPEERVRAVLGTADGFVPYADALRLARELRKPGTVRQAELAPAAAGPATCPFLALRSGRPEAAGDERPAGRLRHAPRGIRGPRGRDHEPRADADRQDAPGGRRAPADMRLVFLNIPGPGGGGGGGGALQKPAPPKAERKGRSAVSSPMPPRPRPLPVEPPQRPAPEPPPTLTSEPMPIVSAPIVQAPAEDRDRAGVSAAGAHRS